MRETTPSLYIYLDGREECRSNSAGQAEYYYRKRIAWEDQRGRCAICHQPITITQATVDHKKPRGMGGGFRDDRQENIQATCWQCNSSKGSRREAR